MKKYTLYLLSFKWNGSEKYKAGEWCDFYLESHATLKLVDHTLVRKWIRKWDLMRLSTYILFSLEVICRLVEYRELKWELSVSLRISLRLFCELSMLNELCKTSLFFFILTDSKLESVKGTSGSIRNINSESSC